MQKSSKQDIPNHTLEENEMVMGADIALELLSEGCNRVVLSLTDEKTNDYELAFKISDHDDDGAYYTVSGPLYNKYIDWITIEDSGIKNTIWICNVTHDVFGEHPNEIYVTNITKKW